MNNKKFADGLISVLSKPVTVYRECTECGRKFPLETSDSDVKVCMPCQAAIDMKLPDDTIINYNLINIWKAGRYDKKNGIDPMLLAIAEGIVLMPDDVEDRTDKTSIISYKKKYSNDDVEKKLKSVIRNANGNYDAVLVLRFGINDDFSIYKVRLSDRLTKSLSEKSELFIKRYISNLVVKAAVKKVQKSKKK